VDILREPAPTGYLSEGDIYHNNDRVTCSAMSSRHRDVGGEEGAAENAAIPAALKCFYVEDPQKEPLELMSRLEESLHWRPRTDLSLPVRIYKLAEGMITLKIEYHADRERDIAERIAGLSSKILADLKKNTACRGGIIPAASRSRGRRHQGQRKEGLRRVTIRLANQMDDLFFVIILASYP
jgi:hypothetical protein